MIGRTLRQYLVTDKLGQGGMGVVWKARDTILDRDVALKVLPVDDTDAAARKERFLREAKAASALNHPSIITIYEINSVDGIHFIAMEYVSGQTLGALLRRGRLTIEQIIRYAIQITDAVGRAHNAGIVHRDLKPGNIMVTDDGLVKVLDFGLAKVRRPTSDGPADNITDIATQMALTGVGSTVGTLGYMSPEQAIGDNVDARSDVFSFGVILYEMLARTLPFEAGSRIDALHKLHFSEPPALTSLRPDTPASVAAIVARTLAKKPVDRYANLTEVVAELRAAVSGESVISTATQPRVASFDLRQTVRVMGSRMAVAAGVAAILLAAVLGAIVWRWRGPVVSSNAPGSNASVNEPVGAYELTRQATALLARQDKEGNVDRAIALLERALREDKTSALAYAHLSEAYLRKHQTNPDAQWLTQARDTAQHATELNPDLAAARLALGFVHLEAGERPEAAAEFVRAADLDPLNPLPHVGLGMNASAQNQDVEAAAAFQKAIQLGPQEWRSHSEYGQFFYRRARYSEAAAEWGSARKLTPDNVLILRNLGATYYMLGRYDEAASTFQRALEVRPSASTYTNLGTLRFFQGRYSDAVGAFEKAVELGANNYLYWGNLGDGYRWAPGRRSDAPAAYRRASELLRPQIAKKSQDADLRTRHALYLAKMGDRPAALKEIESVADGPTLTSQMLYRLAVVYELAGDRPRALSALERALKAGYPSKELESEPELIALRADAQYHRLLLKQPSPAK